eukprot:1139547-Pelagomonas_calceolata.AAC.2
MEIPRGISSLAAPPTCVHNLLRMLLVCFMFTPLLVLQRPSVLATMHWQPNSWALLLPPDVDIIVRFCANTLQACLFCYCPTIAQLQRHILQAKGGMLP